MTRVLTSVVAIVQASVFVTLFAGSAAGEATSNILLSGLNEVPAVVITDASGRFRGVISKNEDQIEYTLTYQDIDKLRPAERVTQAHIHLGQQHVSGSIILWLCYTTRVNVPMTIPLPPVCPDTGGTVTGVLTEANLIPAAAQGVTTLPAAVEAIRAGVAYVNVHTTVSGPGAIRGQFPGKH